MAKLNRVRHKNRVVVERVAAQDLARDILDASFQVDYTFLDSLSASSSTTGRAELWLFVPEFVST
jgi:hypothetical protein